MSDRSSTDFLKGGTRFGLRKIAGLMSGDLAQRRPYVCWGSAGGIAGYGLVRTESALLCLLTVASIRANALVYRGVGPTFMT